MSKIYCILAPLLVAVSLFVKLCTANLYGLTTKTGFDNSVYLFCPTERHFSLAKRDASGEMLFSNEYGGTGGASYEVGFDMALDEARGIVYIVGSTESHDLYGAPAVSRGSTEGFVMKLDPDTGTVLSTRRYAAASVVVCGCAIDSTGSLWFTGYAYGNYYDHVPMVATSSYMMVQKIGKSGETLFLTMVGGDFGAIGTAMVIDSDDNAYAAGFSISDVVDGQVNARARLEDVLVVKFDSAGNKLWTKLLGGTRDDRPSAIAVDSVNNRIYISGTTYSPEFYGQRIPPNKENGGIDKLPFLLVLSTKDGSRLSSTVYLEGTTPPPFPPFVTEIASATPTVGFTVFLILCVLCLVPRCYRYAIKCVRRA